ncbi:3-beta hydroxysteroid dehydrogenase [Advenella kashmirensis W13003]|uniref:3-beta hydroxysteroid dehydrogenase n=1 Tax=Advenella kashmirensis W13003 TaxID=1424334 RepID=V8QMM5_9BURK|nr:NAD(P)-dependent oxidoreductase [Advenella kashmirensis]ETF00259.1 3-beta hydroxysteroid dehydrogenase [Advenella kashmirensis W13003]
MKIAIIGVNGRVGSRIAAEALRRGHQVTGVVHSTRTANAPAGVAIVQGDANQPDALAPLLRGHDAVVSAVRFHDLKAAPLLQALKLAEVKRLLVVGGAASLETSPGRILLDSPDFPDAYKSEAVPGKQFLDDLRGEKEVDWTFLSPSAQFEPGERTGKFRIGADQLLADTDGKSHISMEDYAIAMVDELERPRHMRQRFTVGY